jgi:type VI secretion system secreted protein Hcp
MASAKNQFTWYLEVDGIEGDSTRKGHEGEIEIHSVSWSVSQSSSTTGSGRGAAKAEFADLALETRIGRATTQLLLACASGKHIRSATLQACQVDAAGQEVQRALYELNDILITSFTIADGAGPVVQSFTLGYGTVRLTTRSEGREPSPVTFGWDLRRNVEL